MSNFVSDNLSLNVAYVTGTDANRMINTAILASSFQAHMSDQNLFVCDLGMTDNEARFWKNLGLYLPRPDPFPPGLHPWKYKAGVCSYLDTSRYDAVVWLDADMILLRRIHEQVQKIVLKMKKTRASVAVTPDDGNLRVVDVIEHFADKGKDMSGFNSLIDRFRKDLQQFYLNTGFWVMADFGLAEKWSQVTMEQDDWILFEQNVFNALVGGEDHPVLEVPADVWNVHGDLLRDVAIDQQQSKANILHTTSAEQRHHIENRIEYPIGDKVLAGWFKLFERSDLKDVQQQYLLDFLRKNLTFLHECGLLVDPSHA